MRKAASTKKLQYSPLHQYKLPMATIPEDVMHIILLNLPSISQVKFKCVCKAWKHLFESFEFIENHINRSLQPGSINSSLILTCGSSLYLIDHHDQIPSPRPRKLALHRSFQHNDNTIKVVGSCNGLLCIASGKDLNHYLVCNPYYPKSFKILPFAHNELSRRGPWYAKPLIVTGFGYDHLSDDYKILYAWWNKIDPSNYGYRSEVMVYSMRGGSWKSIEHPSFSGQWGNTQGVLLGDSLHWSVMESDDDSPYKLYTFCLQDEEWYELDLPDCGKDRHVGPINVFKGCLSAILMVSGGSEVEFWVMKEYDVKESWTRLFTVPNGTSLVIHYPMRPCQVLLAHKHDGARCQLSWFSLEEKKIVQRVEIQDDLVVSDVKRFVGSLSPVRTKSPGKKCGNEGNQCESKDVEAGI